MRLKRLRYKLNPLGIVSALLLISLIAVLLSQWSKPLPEMLIAKRDLSLGQELRAEDFEVVGIDLGPAKNFYLEANQFRVGSVLTDSIDQGEVLSIDQVGMQGPKGFTAIRFKPELPVAESLEVGDQVSIWAVSGQQFDQLEPAEQLSQGLLVQIQASEGLFADDQPYVEVTIPEETIPQVLRSMAAEDKVFLVEPGL